MSFPRLDSHGLTTLVTRLARDIKQGHAIVDNSGNTMTSRTKLKFKGRDVTDDATNDTTVIEPEIKVVSTQEEWEQMTPQEKNNPNVTWLLPWKTNPDTNRHQIVNGNGTLFTDRTKLQIIGGYVEDDSENNTTKIYVWNALLTITTPSALLYGKTITIKKDGVTVGTVAFSAQGVASYPVHEIGTYKCYCDGYESDDISVEEEKAYSVVIRAGLDLAAWITAGSTTEYPLNPSSYADFAALEADEAAIRQLMLVHDAVDYLATATAGDSLMQSVINSDVCAKWINLSDYALDTLSANSDIASEMATADKYGYGEWVKLSDSPETWGAKGNVPIMTANNAPYGVAATDSVGGGDAYKVFDGDDSSFWSPSSDTGNHYVSYTSVNPICVRRVKYRTGVGQNSARIKAFRIEASNDNFASTPVVLYSGTNPADGYDKDMYVDISTNDQYYTSHRMYIVDKYESGYYTQILTLQFYGRELSPLVPTMTDADKPKGTVTASSEYNDTTRAKWRAFNGDKTDGWMPTEANGYNNNYVQYTFTEAMKVTMAEFFLTSGGSSTVITSSKIEGSTDGLTFGEIGSIDCAYNADKCVPVTSALYKAVRGSITGKSPSESILSGNGYNFQFYGFDYSEKEFAPGSTMKYIYDHGVELVEIKTYNSNSSSKSEKRSNELYYYDNGTNIDGGFGTNSKIDITPYSTWRIIGGNEYLGSSFSCEVSSHDIEGTSSAYSVATLGLLTDSVANRPYNHALDVSSVNGEYYLLTRGGHTASAYATATIKEIWLE